MQRAIYNLLLNACQSAHRAEGRREVVVSIATSGEQIDLTVTDSGPGVVEHIRDSLFQPFVSEGKHSGTGLGLTLANAIAKEHGGCVTLMSTRPGETIFQLKLNRHTSEMSAAISSPQDTSLPTQGGNPR
jgi:nitrogen-specific signal transduction histidine kinase